jgi:hypothetical protein
MKPILSEKNLVVILFIMVIVIFSFAQADTRKMTAIYSEAPSISKASLMGDLPSKVESYPEVYNSTYYSPVLTPSMYSNTSSLPLFSVAEVKK